MATNGNGNGDYTGENIKILEGLEAVRLRPAMYIGSTGEMGLHHLVYEVVDNSVDEALAGYAHKIDVTIHVDNSITVVDDGRGIPVDMMPVGEGKMMPAVQVVLTKLHAGGKFDSSNYKVSGGLHGVGVSCVNALSQEFNVEIWRDGHTWEMDFSCGDPTSELRKTGVSKKFGTKIHFLPDKSIFAVTEYNYDTLSQRLRELAFLNKGLEIVLTDERTVDPKTGDSKRAEFRYVGGIAEFVKHLNRGKSVLHEKPIVMEAQRENVGISLVRNHFRGRKLLANDFDGVGIGFAAADDANFYAGTGWTVEKIERLADGHVARREAADGFKNVAAVDAGFFGRAVGQDGNHDDVAEALAEREAGFAGAGVLLLLLVLGVLARSEVAGFGVERFEQAVERAGGDEVHVGLVHIIGLDLVEDFAVDGEGFVGFVVGGAAQNVADACV